MKGKVLKKAMALMCAVSIALSAGGYAAIAQRATVVDTLTMNDAPLLASEMMNPVLKYQETLYYALDEIAQESLGVAVKETDQAIQLTVTGLNQVAHWARMNSAVPKEAIVTVVEKELWVDGTMIMEKDSTTPLLRAGNVLYLPIGEEVTKAMYWSLEKTGDKQFVTIPTKTELAQMRGEKQRVSAVSHDVNAALFAFDRKVADIDWQAEKEPDKILAAATPLVETGAMVTAHFSEVRASISEKLAQVHALEVQIPDRRACEAAYHTRLAEVKERITQLKQQPKGDHYGTALRGTPGYKARKEEVYLITEYADMLVYLDRNEWQHYTALVHESGADIRENLTSKMGWRMDYSNNLFYGQMSTSLEPKGLGVKYFDDRTVIGTYDTTDEALDALTISSDGTKWYEWLGEDQKLMRLTVHTDGSVVYGPEQSGRRKNGAFYTLLADGTLILRDYINGYAYPNKILQQGDRVEVVDMRQSGYAFAVAQGVVVEVAQAKEGVKEGMAYRTTNDGISYWGPVEKGLAKDPDRYVLTVQGTAEWGSYIDRQVSRAYEEGQDKLTKIQRIATYGKQLRDKRPGQSAYMPMTDTGMGTLLTLGGTPAGRLEALSLVLNRAGIEHAYMTAVGVEYPWIMVKTDDGVLHMDIANAVEQTVAAPFTGFASASKPKAVPQIVEDGLYTTEEMLQRLNVAPAVAASWVFSGE